MKSTNVKAMVTKVMLAGFMAGAFVMAAPAKAEAQGFPVAIEVGYPHYDYSRRDAYEFQRREEIRRHEEWVRHEEWLRAHRFHDRYGYR